MNAMKNMKSFSNLVFGDKIYALTDTGGMKIGLVTDVKTNGTNVISITFRLDNEIITKNHIIGLDGYMYISKESHNTLCSYEMFANLDDIKARIEQRINTLQSEMNSLILSLSEVNVALGA